MKHLTILATGPSRWKYEENDSDVWGVNSSVQLMETKFNKLFFFDELKLFGPKKGADVNDEENAAKKFMQFKKENDLEIVTRCHYKGLESTLYPYKEVRKMFPESRYFINSVSYMIAYALYLGYKRIDLVGVDMVTNLEYIIEKAGCEYWIGLGRGMGVEINITKGSALCPDVQYGYRGLAWLKLRDEMGEKWDAANRRHELKQKLVKKYYRDETPEQKWKFYGEDMLRRKKELEEAVNG